MPIKHHNQSGRGDSDDSGAIQPSHWNADHDLTGLLALIDALALTPNSFFTLDGSNHPVMKPLSSILTVDLAGARRRADGTDREPGNQLDPDRDHRFCAGRRRGTDQWRAGRARYAERARRRHQR
jgi:hypothetical protein